MSRAAVIAGVRAALEAVAELPTNCDTVEEFLWWAESLDPAAIAAGVSVEPGKRDAELVVAERLSTRFEQRGRMLGHEVRDLMYLRTA